MKLDRLIARHHRLGRKEAHRRIAAGRVSVDGLPVTLNQHEVDRFVRVEMDGETIQQPARLLRLIMYKPAGILSATRDPAHRTVLDLIDDPDKDTLHLAGRLDRATSGLLLLTNDGRWSKALTIPDRQVPKVYLVETLHPIDPATVDSFARGFHFHTENIFTRPARLEILGDRLARLTLHEGRYHQVKRMFHRVRNRVAALHRERIGGLALPADLPPGAWRELTDGEAAAVLHGEPGTPRLDCARHP